MSETQNINEGASGHAHAHEHDHGHHAHAHGPGHDYAKENEKHFDEKGRAAEYDARADVQEFARRIREAILKTHASLFDEDKTTLLDFACGTGEPLRS